MFYNLNEDLITIVISYLDYDIVHNINFIKNKLINFDLLLLKRTNKYIYNIIEKYYNKNYNYKKIYIVNKTITNYYINIINTIYCNEIS